jgi:hypothetical protein
MTSPMRRGRSHRVTGSSVHRVSRRRIYNPLILRFIPASVGKSSHGTPLRLCSGPAGAGGMTAHYFLKGRVSKMPIAVSSLNPAGAKKPEFVWTPRFTRILKDPLPGLKSGASTAAHSKPFMIACLYFPFSCSRMTIIKASSFLFRLRQPRNNCGKFIEYLVPAF